jgi:hypothetical protein
LTVTQVADINGFPAYVTDADGNGLEKKGCAPLPNSAVLHHNGVVSTTVYIDGTPFGITSQQPPDACC